MCHYMHGHDHANTAITADSARFICCVSVPRGLTRLSLLSLACAVGPQAQLRSIDLNGLTRLTVSSCSGSANSVKNAFLE